MTCLLNDSASSFWQFELTHSYFLSWTRLFTKVRPSDYLIPLQIPVHAVLEIRTPEILTRQVLLTIHLRYYSIKWLTVGPCVSESSENWENRPRCHSMKRTSSTTMRMILSVTVMFGNIRCTEPPMPSKARLTITATTPMTSIAS